MVKPRFLVIIVVLMVVSFVAVNLFNLQHLTELTSDKNSQTNGVFRQKNDFIEQLNSLRLEIETLKSDILLTKQLQVEIASLKNELVLLKSYISSQQNVVNTSQLTSTTLTESIDLSDGTFNIQQSKNNAMVLIQHNFDQEVVDNSWSIAMTSLLNSAFSSLDKTGGTLSNIECRTTMCRVDMIYDNQGSLDEFYAKFSEQVSEHLPNFDYEYEKFANDKIGVTLYLAKN